MKKVTLREYARLHKISYFQAMKMVNRGEVKSETIEENGKDVHYVLIDENEIEKKIEETPKETLTLEEENKILKEEIIALKEALERCNRRTILA